jgi:hypothetical protein
MLNPTDIGTEFTIKESSAAAQRWGKFNFSRCATRRSKKRSMQQLEQKPTRCVSAESTDKQ